MKNSRSRQRMDGIKIRIGLDIFNTCNYLQSAHFLKGMPFTQFKTWYQEERALSQAALPAACCMSTMGLDGFPNARFVSLKEIHDDAFVITGSMASRKGRELQAQPEVALTFWWPVTKRQVRIQGLATPIDSTRADGYFYARNRESKIVSMLSEQGKLVEETTSLHGQYLAAKSTFADVDIQRPQDWGGWDIQPIRIEFLDFSDDRFHERVLYQKEAEAWVACRVEP